MARSPLAPAVARTAWRRAEPIHAMIYFAPEARQRYGALGLDGLTGYFASRSAAFGAVPAEPVVATFFNFKPALVHAALPAAWERAAPTAVLRARLDAADAALRRAFADLEDGAGTPAVAEAAGLARRAAESACEQLPGRPLFAAHAALPWPDEPHLVLWHAQTLLREFRGDGHVSALLLAGLNGLEALVLHAATGDVPVRFLRRSRGWTSDEWAEAVDELRSRGLLADGDDLALTEAGRELRQSVEDRTDALAEPAYRVLGEDGCARLAELARPLSRAVVDAGLLDLKATPTAG
ncbi:SCO6745 family protein [Micromonospora sp. URMC 105]|uniref:SCO6745 family protein n=1 Tax=Micromonospora sp. URMC 105 TaxID=3423413 RepID=UPI003F1E1E41